MSHSQFHSIELFILRHAWLNLWDERMTTGRINQVAIHGPHAHKKINTFTWIPSKLLTVHWRQTPAHNKQHSTENTHKDENKDARSGESDAVIHNSTSIPRSTSNHVHTHISRSIQCNTYTHRWAVLRMQTQSVGALFSVKNTRPIHFTAGDVNPTCRHRGPHSDVTLQTTSLPDAFLLSF